MQYAPPPVRSPDWRIVLSRFKHSTAQQSSVFSQMNPYAFSFGDSQEILDTLLLKLLLVMISSSQVFSNDIGIFAISTLYNTQNHHRSHFFAATQNGREVAVEHVGLAAPD